MNTKLFAVAAVCALAASGWAAPLESLRSSAEADFAGLSGKAAGLPAAEGAGPVDAAPVEAEPQGPLPEFQGPVIVEPKLAPAPPLPLGPEIGSFVLAERLDSHRDLFTKQLGAQNWDLSIAGDAVFKTVYLTFAQKDKLLLRKIEDPNRLRGEGVVVTIDPQTAYRFKVSINIFNPVRGSTLKIDPVNGTRGPAHKLSTGEILDRMKQKSFVFQASGREFWLLYGTDVDNKTESLAGTRSFLFIREDGMSSKAWPLAETALETDKPAAVSLGDTTVTLVKGSDGKLHIHGSGSGATAWLRSGASSR